MAERKRVLRRITGRPQSPYRVDVRKVPGGEVVLLRIFDEKDMIKPLATFEFIAAGTDIYFKAIEVRGLWQIRFINDVTIRRSSIDLMRCLWFPTG